MQRTSHAHGAQRTMYNTHSAIFGDGPKISSAGLAIYAPFDACGFFLPCQRCGLPHTAAPGMHLPCLSLRLPLHLCLQCRCALASLDSAAGASSPDRRLRLLAACSALACAPWWGESEGEASAARSALGAACAVAILPLLMVGGLVGCGCVGAILGGVGGFFGGFAIVFDAGNRLAQAVKPALGVAGLPPSAHSCAPAPPGAPPGPPYLAALSLRLKALSLLDEGTLEADAAREAARMAAPATAYAVLGAPPDAPLEALTRAYKLLSLAYHPDHNPAPSAHRVSAAINSAMALVCDAEKRAAGGHTCAAADAAASKGASTGPAVALSSTLAGWVGGVLGCALGCALGLGAGAVMGALMGAVKGATTAAAVARGARHMVRTAGDTVRRAAAEAARAAAGASPPAPLAMSARGSALRVALPGAARGVVLSSLKPVCVPSVDCLMKPEVISSPAHLSSVGARAGGGGEGAQFAAHLASAAAAVAAATRAEMGVPEPPLYDGKGRKDATGADGDDDAAAGGPITTGGGLLQLACEGAKNVVNKQLKEAAARALAERGAAWEAATRGRAPTAGWLARRAAGLLFARDGGAITDPNKGQGAEGTLPPRAGAAAPRYTLEVRAVGDAQWAAPTGVLAPVEGALEVEGGVGGLLLELPLPRKKTEVRALLALQQNGAAGERVVVAEGVFAP